MPVGPRFAGWLFAVSEFFQLRQIHGERLRDSEWVGGGQRV